MAGYGIFSDALDQAGNIGKVLVDKGPHAAIVTAMEKARAGVTGSTVPEAIQWDLDKANGVHLKEVALARGWPRMSPGTYMDPDHGRIYYEEDPEDLAEEIVAEGL